VQDGRDAAGFVAGRYDYRNEPTGLCRAVGEVWGTPGQARQRQERNEPGKRRQPVGGEVEAQDVRLRQFTCLDTA
jgi:hypothetical protein